MITNAFFLLPLGLFSIISLIFPVISIPSEIASSLASAVSSLWALNSFIPIPTLAIVVGTIFGVEILLFSFNFLRWVFSHIPFIGGRGVN